MNTEIINNFLLEFEVKIDDNQSKIRYGQSLIDIYTEKGDKQNSIIAIEQSIKDIELKIATYEAMIQKLKGLL